ncbi:MAG: Asp-tRNA(Asn)/Glu-tRNA(Gln) amidotransferase subunit GatB [Coriobacteriales bacterium]|jgi:aspartyl-tRNA(Asn)/glutamyl-tRNA(Gln) amidotransferase subunit B|nr:Asp-tRNA(Asn)/Glu-tRNA(Gln) amidotransferase subunit GatB [Coriobacteriales bacterium]
MHTLEEALQDWEAVIGLEIHAELTYLNTKMFCSCKLEYGDEPNTNVCPVCLGLPGALPQPNRAAVQAIVAAGLATGCRIMPRSMFYRKNYFYPDMSKNFQTTQGPVAFCMDGGFDLEIEGKAALERKVLAGTDPLDGAKGYRTHIDIERIHLEEDAGKLTHMGGESGRISGAAYSLVDYNRCGTPLIELVTRPDLRTPEEARHFMQTLRTIYRAIHISDCSMEKGSLRCDGNVSLRRRGETELGTKTELKNMNSFKSLHDGLAYEIRRQAEILEEGGQVVQETRHFEPASGRTISMRKKETAADYRLFPEPDMVPFDLSEEFIEGVRASLPELPQAKRERYITDYALSRQTARELAADPDLSAAFDAALNSSTATAKAAPTWAKKCANLLLNQVTAYLKETHHELSESALKPADLAAVASALETGQLSSNQADQVLTKLLDGSGKLDELLASCAAESQDSGELDALVSQVLADNPDKVTQYKAGKTGLIGFFVGQVMQLSQGKANPKQANQLLSAALAG